MNTDVIGLLLGNDTYGARVHKKLRIIDKFCTYKFRLEKEIVDEEKQIDEIIKIIDDLNTICKSLNLPLVMLEQSKEIIEHVLNTYYIHLLKSDVYGTSEVSLDYKFFSGEKVYFVCQNCGNITSLPVEIVNDMYENKEIPIECDMCQENMAVAYYKTPDGNILKHVEIKRKDFLFR